MVPISFELLDEDEAEYRYTFGRPDPSREVEFERWLDRPVCGTVRQQAHWLHRATGGVCELCGWDIDIEARHPDPGCAQVDHIVPTSRGGSNTWRNVRVVHRQCNMERNSGTPLQRDEYRRRLTGALRAHTHRRIERFVEQLGLQIASMQTGRLSYAQEDLKARVAAGLSQRALRKYEKQAEAARQELEDAREDVGAIIAKIEALVEELPMALRPTWKLSRTDQRSIRQADRLLGRTPARRRSKPAAQQP